MTAAPRTVHAGYTSRRRPTVEELTIRLEYARAETHTACSRYTRLRARVLDYLEALPTDRDAYLVRLRQEVGRQAAQDRSRTEVEREMDGLEFVGAHRRMRGR